MAAESLSILEFFERLKWIDGRPLLPMVEPYRRRLFERAFSRDADGQFLYSMVLSGRAKKNFKTTDAVLASLFALVDPTPGDAQVYIVANDKDQAGDDLTLAKKIIRANPFLDAWMTLKRNSIERNDGNGFIEVLPAQDAVGSHGKTFRLVAFDEIHGYRNWDLLEALAPDPSRRDAQQWLTTYASIFHKPGVPLFDLLKLARGGADPRLLFSWYAGDFTTDPDFEQLEPAARANPSMASWGNADYLAQQQRRLPAHKFRRLHLNLPGLPEGSAFKPEPVTEAIARGVAVRLPSPIVKYSAFVDMSGGSSDDAVLAIAHVDSDGRAVLDVLQDQGAAAPFDPRLAVERFARTLATYRCSSVVGDAYAGETFRADFSRHGISYVVSDRSRSELYEAFEPMLNGGATVLLDVPKLEQQLFGLVWRGGKIDHPNGEHDDYANAAAGVIVTAHHPSSGWLEYAQQVVAESSAVENEPAITALKEPDMPQVTTLPAPTPMIAVEYERRGEAPVSVGVLLHNNAGQLEGHFSDADSFARFCQRVANLIRKPMRQDEAESFGPMPFTVSAASNNQIEIHTTHGAAKFQAPAGVDVNFNAVRLVVAP